MDATFKEGDVVQLKSGSPQMTIVRLYQNEGDSIYYSECTWYDFTTNEWHYDVPFCLHLLKKA